MHTNNVSSSRKHSKKLNFHVKSWWVICVLLVLFVNWRQDYTVYDECDLIEVSCVYQQIDINGGYRANKCYIIDNHQQAYLLDMDNIRSLQNDLKTGDILIMKIEPRRSEFFLYDKQIAYLESHGLVLYSLDDYTAAKQEKADQRQIIVPLVILFLAVSLIVILFCQDSQRHHVKKKRNKN